MDDVASLHYDETPKAKTLRYVVWGLIGIFVITVTIIALVQGFTNDGLEGYSLLGIACFLYTLTTFFMNFKIANGDLSDAARIPVYIQLLLSVFFGVSILLAVYNNYHPPELDCYYDNSRTMVSKQWGCWEPPNCYSGPTGTSRCVINTGGSNPGSDQCGNVLSTHNTTNNRYTYTCTYSYTAPTPKPTLPPAPTPNTFKAYDIKQPPQVDIYQQQLINKNEKKDNKYYSDYVNDITKEEQTVNITKRKPQPPFGDTSNN